MYCLTKLILTGKAKLINHEIRQLETHGEPTPTHGRHEEGQSTFENFEEFDEAIQEGLLPQLELFEIQRKCQIVCQRHLRTLIQVEPLWSIEQTFAPTRNQCPAYHRNPKDLGQDPKPEEFSTEHWRRSRFMHDRRTEVQPRLNRDWEQSFG